MAISSLLRSVGDIVPPCTETSSPVTTRLNRMLSNRPDWGRIVVVVRNLWLWCGGAEDQRASRRQREPPRSYTDPACGRGLHRLRRPLTGLVHGGTRRRVAGDRECAHLARLACPRRRPCEGASTTSS